jgi:hypothetical protein
VIRTLLVVAVLLVSPKALAYHEVESFSVSANTGGGAGMFYTGSKRFKSYDCSVCHVDAEKRISIEIDSPLGSGTYRAGLIYPITVRLIGEHRGLESAFNPNTFTADFTDSSGLPVGFVASGGSQVLLESERTVAVAEGFGEGETEWSFSWWAPDVAVPITLHIAMLDGDGANDPVRRFIDPLNDDVATLSLQLCPEGESCEVSPESEEEVAPMGCALANESGLLGAFLSLFFLCIWRRRGRGQ